MAERNVKLYDLRQKSGKILGGKNRIAHCGCSPVSKGNISVIKDAEGKHYFNGLQSCGNIWLCPVCAVQIATQRQEEVQRIMYHYLGEGHASIGFLTLTVPHKITHKFKDCKNRVLKAWRDIQQSWEYRYLCDEYRHLGDIRALEVKVNKKNGWHPHLHIAVFANCSDTQLQRFGNRIIDIWQDYHGYTIDKTGKKNFAAKRIGQSFRPIYNAKGVADYITKMNPLDSKWNAASEMTMAHLKTASNVDYQTYSPFDLLCDLQDKWKEKKYKAYAYNIKGTRQLTFSKDVRRIHKMLNGGKTDTQLANEKKEGELVLKIDKEVWREITHRTLQAYVLNKLKSEHITALILFLCQYDIYTEYDTASSTLRKIAVEQKFILAEKPPPTDFVSEFVQPADVARAQLYGIIIKDPPRDMDWRLKHPERPVMYYKVKGDKDWSLAANKWLSS